MRGASKLARALGVPPLIVGLTVVSMGTSAPELVVCVVSAWRGEDALVLGNAVGSNIINVLIVLGIAAMIAPIPIQWGQLKKDAGVMIAASILLIALSFDGLIARAEAGLLMLLLGAYLCLAVLRARKHSLETRQTENGDSPPRSRLPLLAITIVLGLVGLTYGARWMVDAAVAMADQAGISKTIIGLTIVAGGTSLPELATFVVAAIHRQQALAVGNIIGSNIFNILGIIGAAGLLCPLGVTHDLLYTHYAVMFGAALALVLVMAIGKKVSRWEGATLLGLYAAYAAYLVHLSRSAP